MNDETSGILDNQELWAGLADRASQLQTSTDWPSSQLDLCRKHGVYRWFSGTTWGGFGWSDDQITTAYTRLASHCLTTTFVITQRQAAVKRIENSTNDYVKNLLLPDLVEGKTLATVGISHLTTSLQHLREPTLTSVLSDNNVVLNGYSPWVTGAQAADWLVVGATLPDRQQILVVVDRNSAGVRVHAPLELVALSASQTGQVSFDQVSVTSNFIIAGPASDVMRVGNGGSTGSLQTSALAVGLARAAIDFLKGESKNRADLQTIATSLEQQWQVLNRNLEILACGQYNPTSGISPTQTNANQTSVPLLDLIQIRGDANSLVLRSTQAALSAAKGRGYMSDHPVGRWCREALFFLVWSCPQQVVDSNLCEFASGELTSSSLTYEAP